MEPLPYSDYGSAIRSRLGGRVQKLAIDAHLGCPNRDGTIAYGGCSFCCGEAFSPAYCREAESITAQINHAIEFHNSRRRHSDIYLAYFQAGTNTHAPIDHLRSIYSEALSHPKVSGLIVGTRPDCINADILQLLADFRHRHYVAIELGIESVYDTTLQHINRGHTFADTVAAVADIKASGIDVGGHIILGLPHETRSNLIESTGAINTLNLTSIKFHQLQIYRNTPIAHEWCEHPDHFLFGTGDATEQYISLLIDIIRHLRADTAIERFVSEAPRHLLLHSPLGGVRPDTLRREVINRLRAMNWQQGDLYFR